jgi:RNA polymerase sigma-70 factor (ECF subfamily)
MEEALRPRLLPAEEPLDGQALASASDTELMAACQDPESASGGFRELLSRYRKSALALAYQMLGNVEDAEDAAQEAFVRVFQAMPQFRGQASFSTWLYRIVTNTCLARIRRHRSSTALETLPEPRGEDSPSDQVANGLLTRQVLHQMPPGLQAVLLLRVEGGLSYREIADALGLPIGTVRSRLSKARIAFRKLWNEFERGSGDGAPAVGQAGVTRPGRANSAVDSVEEER